MSLLLLRTLDLILASLPSPEQLPKAQFHSCFFCIDKYVHCKSSFRGWLPSLCSYILLDLGPLPIRLVL